MLVVNGLSKTYGSKTVLEDVSFSLNRGVKAGLVGANGAGKSTLLRILAGLEKADRGTIEIQSAVAAVYETAAYDAAASRSVASQAAGYLPQHLLEAAQDTVREVLARSTGGLESLRRRIRDLEDQMSRTSGPAITPLMEVYGDLSARFEAAGGYTLEYRLNTILQGLKIEYLDLSRRVETLSGGEKTRLCLAGLLLGTPDLLLLDEPTNNLDPASLEWLAGYLDRYSGTILVASHDRYFLNQMVDEILEIDEHNHRLTRYGGSYDAYKAARAGDRVCREEDYQRQQAEISRLKKEIKSQSAGLRRPEKKAGRDNDKFARYYLTQSHAQKAATHNLHSAEERLKRIEQNPLSRPPRELRFNTSFIPVPLHSAVAIQAAGLGMAYPERPLFNNLSFELGSRSRVVIQGPNGTGKSTLLRILAGQTQPDRGRVTLAPAARPGYLPQEPTGIDPELSVLEYYSRGLSGSRNDFVFDLVGCGVFRYEEISRKAGSLSLGQLRKLQIARLIAAQPNLLLLDEPTNHLSLDVLESLEESLESFKGSVVAVSHDRYFSRRIKGEIWVLEKGRLIISDTGTALN